MTLMEDDHVYLFATRLLSVHLGPFDSGMGPRSTCDKEMKVR